MSVMDQSRAPAGLRRTGPLLRAFVADQNGGIAMMGILWFTLLAGIGGLAVDAANGYRLKAMLQATADAAALAAVIDLPDTVAARETAFDYISANLSATRHGVLASEDDVKTGKWSESARVFTEGLEPADAVMVTLARSSKNDNPVFVTLLRVVGYTSMDVVVQSVAMRYYPGCLSREGFISAKRVTMTSDTHYVNGFCIHGAEGVTVGNGNSFEEGVKVTMEDLADFVMPTQGFDSNPGLEAALGEDYYDLFILQMIDQIVAALKDPNSEWQPSYIDDDKPALTARRGVNSISASGLEERRVHYLPCNAGDNALNLPGSMTYRNVVIVTDCRISIGSKARFQNVTMATTWKSTSSASVDAASAVQWGADDNCAAGGGARVITPGQVQASAQNRYFGAQFISNMTVSVAANADGGTGVSVISAEDISLTSSHGYMGLCSGKNVETETYRLTYFRLAA